jgi:predicted O-methyltransferase YrrM
MEMLATVKHYVQHLFKSFHLHGIHSPFIFEFEKKCLRDSHSYGDYLKLSRFRESIHNNDTILKIEDHGAGSKVFKTNTRSTNDILKHNSSSQKTAQLFYRIATYFEAERILEFGTSLGIATHAFATARPDAFIETVEGSPEVADYSRSLFKKNGLKNVHVISTTFQEFIDDKRSQNTDCTYDLIYLDGHHDGSATVSYFEQLLDFAHDNTVFILDDIYWSRDMTVAWEKLCIQNMVTAAVDTFDLGFLFLRKEQLQQRFHILM